MQDHGDYLRVYHKEHSFSAELWVDKGKGQSDELVKEWDKIDSFAIQSRFIEVEHQRFEDWFLVSPQPRGKRVPQLVVESTEYALMLIITTKFFRI